MSSWEALSALTPLFDQQFAAAKLLVRRSKVGALEFAVDHIVEECEYGLADRPWAADEDLPGEFWVEWEKWSAADWLSGEFEVWWGNGRKLCVSGLRFSRAGVDALLTEFARTAETSQVSDHPAVEDEALTQWLAQLRSRGLAERLTILEIWALAKAAFPDRKVVRRRIEDLVGHRKPGRKEKPAMTSGE